MTGKVTMIIATRDRRDELIHTLCRLSELTPPPPLIVVDNGSTDGTAHAVHAQFPGVTLLALRHSVAAVAEAVAGLPWVLHERQVVPSEVEHGLRLLEEPQRHSRARRYVG